MICCDVSEAWTSVARKYWAEAGVADKIDLRIGPASETLDGLLADGGEGSYDFAFVDADKSGYDGYYERLLRLVRPGGLIAFDNMLWHDRVADSSVHDADTTTLRELAKAVRADERLVPALLPVGDGLLVAVKR